ncbi:MAG: hypothetical protein V3V96_14340 [Acidiferrobacterales bacterium]
MTALVISCVALVVGGLAMWQIQMLARTTARLAESLTSVAADLFAFNRALMRLKRSEDDRK